MAAWLVVGGDALLDKVGAVKLLDALRQLGREWCRSAAESSNERVALLLF